MRQRETGETAAIVFHVRVLRQFAARKKRQPSAAQFEENDAGKFAVCRQSEAVAIERGAAFQIGNAERDETNAWFHRKLIVRVLAARGKSGDGFFGGDDSVLQQHRDRHRADAADARRHPTRDFRHRIIHVADDFVAVARNAAAHDRRT